MSPPLPSKQEPDHRSHRSQTTEKVHPFSPPLFLQTSSQTNTFCATTLQAVSLYVASQRRKPRVVRSSREQFLHSRGEGGALAELADFFSAPTSGKGVEGGALGAGDTKGTGSLEDGSGRVSPRLEVHPGHTGG